MVGSLLIGINAFFVKRLVTQVDNTSLKTDSTHERVLVLEKSVEGKVDLLSHKIDNLERLFKKYVEPLASHPQERKNDKSL